MSHEEEPFKLFVSRIPSKWTETLMMEHFEDCAFGAIERVELFTGRKNHRPTNHRRGVGNICYAYKNDGYCDKGNECPFSHNMEDEEEEVCDGDGGETGENHHSGNGLVVFATREGKEAALQQSSLHVSHRIVKLREWSSVEDGRDTQTCYAWSNYNCTHGDDCRFAHTGPGSCVVVGTPYQGRRFQCMSWKGKGSCSKGDACSFIHSDKLKAIKAKAVPHTTASTASSSSSSSSSQKNKGERKEEVQVEVEGDAKGASTAGTSGRGLCSQFKKKGKCRRGDDCPYSHNLAAAAASKRSQRTAGNAVGTKERETPTTTSSSSSRSSSSNPDQISSRFFNSDQHLAQKRRITGAVLVESRKKRLNTVTKFDDDNDDEKE